MQKIPKPPHGSLEWLNVRHRDTEGKVTFGASEAGALMGVSEYTTLADLCISKLEPPVMREPEPQMIKGIIFEAPLLAEAARLLGCEVTTPDVMYRKGRFTATLDGLAHNPFVGSGEPFAIVEAKVTAAYTVATAEDLPASWVMQGHVQSWILGLPVYFIVFDKRQHINLIEMPYDETLIESINDMADYIGYELDNEVIPDTAYRELSAEQVASLFPAEDRKTAVADPDVADTATTLALVRQQIRQLKEQEQQLADEVARFMQDATELVDANGFTLLTWRQQKGRQSFDTKAFQAAHGDLYAQFVKEGAPYRVMRFGKGKQ